MTAIPAPVRRRLISKLRPKVVAAATALTTVLLCCTGGLALVLLSGLPGDERRFQLAMNCGAGGIVDISGQMPFVPGYGDNQLRNAAIIIRTGAELEVAPRGWVIAVATAMQESTLVNLGHLGQINDHDSIGLFQQRPSQGWGTPAQLQDPVYSSTKFYRKLLTIPGWETLPLTEAAQAVQISAYPDAYAKHETTAELIVNTLASGAGQAIVEADGSLVCNGAAGTRIAASGWTAPLAHNVGSGFRTADRPTHHGVDIIAPRGAEIHAAASGRVLVAQCDPDQYGRYTCDVDGSPQKMGCGWFVDILHAQNYVTRYCHLVERPYVRVGQKVRAGQVIGRVGTSGNSSGPHLHFEVHVNGDRSSAGAIDPVPFMRGKGAPLTQDS
ncbi:M23 family metallopeptidase [Melissospora conviva]|uniref:M23 family metallopeptidase n=1 Tax=Melissospora conviva TaxID=3388432 RepID=UPI003B7A1040